MGTTSELLRQLVRPEILIAVGATVLVLLAVVVAVAAGSRRQVLPWILAATALTLVATVGLPTLRGTAPSPAPTLGRAIVAAPSTPLAPAPVSPGTPVVTIALGEWDLTTTAAEAPPGDVTFEVHNAGQLPHALRVRSDDGGPRREWRSALIAPGERITLTVALTSGVYELDCPVEGTEGEHDALGMELRFVVHEAAPPLTTMGSGPAAPPATSRDDETAVAIAGFAFAPDPVRVALGARVTWRNDDAAPHTATGEGWSTETLAHTGRGSVTFDALGEHPYRCDLHPTMTGTVVVVEP